MLAVINAFGALLPGSISEIFNETPQGERSRNRQRVKAILFLVVLGSTIVILAAPIIKNAPIRADLAWEGKLQAAQVQLETGKEEDDSMLIALAENDKSSYRKKLEEARAWMRILVAASLIGELLLVSRLGEGLACCKASRIRKRVRKLRHKADEVAREVERLDAGYEYATVEHLMDLGVFVEAVAPAAARPNDRAMPAVAQTPADPQDEALLPDFSAATATDYREDDDDPPDRREDLRPGGGASAVPWGWDAAGFNQA
jgi:hypothetical protein